MVRQQTPSPGTFNKFKLKESLSKEEKEKLIEHYKALRYLCSADPDFADAEIKAIERLCELNNFEKVS